MSLPGDFLLMQLGKKYSLSFGVNKIGIRFGASEWQFFHQWSGGVGVLLENEATEESGAERGRDIVSMNLFDNRVLPCQKLLPPLEDLHEPIHSQFCFLLRVV